ncbi:pyridoxamine 5'-phosphate oxidase family protein [Rhizobium grahamii]|uniref:Flavin-nucleotide-binding protein n=1 Tax=Rhizobium grahamii TaxID=1120045 RepID=A0A370KGL2_9HYPH|nr:pyridoxamine 5'-phosphate oxidase family protein [Rhizobium grahamii]RDJ03777.1 flavin-nucleotide-binding protein [Rhizobium grahamii]
MPMAIRNMTHHECLEMLKASHYGHLACCHNSQPYVVPVYFAFEASVAYSFSMPGRKVEWMRENPKVCLQVEERQLKGSWRSVVLHGEFQELPDNDAWHEERLHAWSLLQKHIDWWEIGSLKPDVVPPAHTSPHLFFGIHKREVTGRSAMQIDQ